MPPDTTQIPSKAPLPMDQAIIDSLLYHQDGQTILPPDEPRFLFPQWVLLLFILAAFAVFFFIARPLRSYTSLYLRRGLRKQAKDLLTQKEKLFHDLLSRYNPYYKSLSPELKEVFLFRVAVFLSVKEFKFHSLSYEEKITVLVSGAAVQITFGMENFLMDYFPVIHVIKQEYNIAEDKETYYGHVNRKGIHVAWNHFIEGFEDYQDGVNVGLHEMAHAVSFDVFFSENSDHQDYQLKKKLAAFTETAKPVFYAIREGYDHVLDPYAGSNFKEFWAVSVEHFFEKPEALRDREPKLYEAIVDLLNQDPLTKNRIINKSKAGIM